MPRRRLPAAYCPLTGHATARVHSAAMPSRARARSAASRTEARRRARLEARVGDLPAAELEDEEAVEAQRRPSGGILRLLFPPAPPLAGKPDPLAGFTGSGWTRPLALRLHLLRANPTAWLGFGVLAGIGYVLSSQLATDALGFVANLLMFGALVAAGWFGWQRPALYGTVAAVVGYVLGTALLLIFFTFQGAAPTASAPVGLFLANVVVYAALQAILGFVAGWYGGYLRRRQAALPTAVRRPRR
jgi:hypothetical protein